MRAAEDGAWLCLAGVDLAGTNEVAVDGDGPPVTATARRPLCRPGTGRTVAEGVHDLYLVMEAGTRVSSITFRAVTEDRRPVTIADVARHAGVSASTVSYVLSGKRTISESTRARVLASVRALGFHPHAGARALASNRANQIALALPLRTGMHLPVLMQFATAVVTAARRPGTTCCC